ncbi:MAG TPA: primosomal protein N', partial [Firmicutes bacterium]|nr:primosomal protein N' [Bacillota bacterium]
MLENIGKKIENEPESMNSERNPRWEYARVVPLTSGRINRSLTYFIPENLRDSIETGSVVAIEVRRSLKIGIVTGFEQLDESDKAMPYKIKEIYSVYTDEHLIRPIDIEIARWIGSYYSCSLRDALAPFAPEVRALQAVVALVANDAVKFKNELNALGLLFSRHDAIQLDERPDGAVRIVRSELIDMLKLGSMSEKKSEETIRKWLDTGLLKPEICIRNRVSQLGQGSHLSITETGKNAVLSKLRSDAQREVMKLLGEIGGTLARDEILREIPRAKSALHALVKKGLLEEIIDESLLPDTGLPTPEFKLSKAQNDAVDSVAKSVESGKSETFLLFGVTGSGKTEVYMEACRKAIALGKKATVLVPEIALTYQTVRRFMKAFPGRIALMHSELTERERLHEWRAVRRGTRDIVIGARSALFTPMPDRGLIIIDEESETAYKQQQRPRYHAREVARRMARIEGSVLLLGSATPSIESFHFAKKGTYTLLRLPARAVGGALPEVRLVKPDVQRKKDASRNETMDIDGKETPISLLSSMLRDEIGKTLQMNRQCLLFLNMRGFAKSLICTDCGMVPMCPMCDISLTFHRKAGIQLCHHCGHSEQAPKVCSKCGNGDLRFLGWGTERLEAEVRALFPNARLLRMDRDTVTTRGRRRSIVDAVRNREVDILLGTQMIAKGLDFPMMRLVGVISADQSLFLPDFRASERTFQLLTQVIGRSGRSDDLEMRGGGIAVIQTFDPENRMLKAACSQDFESFYEYEIVIRQRFGYPPSLHLARVLVSGAIKEDVEDLTNILGRVLEKTKPDGQYSLLGPAQAPLGRLEGKWRYHCLLKAPR